MPLTESTRKKSKTLAIFAGYSSIPAIGLACYRLSAWTMFRSEIGHPAPDFFLLSHIMQAIAILLLLVIDHHIFYDERRLLRAAGVSTAITVIGVCTFLFGSSEMVLMFIGGAICSASSAITLLAWGYYFCSIDPKKSAFGLTFGFTIYGLATWGLLVVNINVIIFLAIAGPIASYVCLHLSISNNNEPVTSDKPFTKQTLATLPWGMFALLLICSFISILAKILVPVSTTLFSSAYRIYWPLIFIAIFILFCVWIFVLKRNDPQRLWPVFALVIFSGLLCYSAFSTTQPSFANSFFRATQECLMLFCWVEVCSLSYCQKLPRITVFGLSVLIFLSPPTIVSTFLSTFFPAQGFTGGDLMAVITTVVLSFILMVLTVLLISKKDVVHVREKNQTKSGEGELSDNSSNRIIENLSEQYGLTQRESEMAYFLSKGYTLPQMASMLCLSLNTVRSHTKHLYRKLDIHKKQELIVLIEQVSSHYIN